MTNNLLPISKIIATRNRSEPLKRTLLSLSEQLVQPVEIIVVDGSDNSDTHDICCDLASKLSSVIQYYRAVELGAAKQRNQAMSYVSQEFIWLVDDDVLFENNCLECLWGAIQSDPNLGGVNATITNQQYGSPSQISRLLFRILHGQAEVSYAGKCIGPAFNLLPEDRPDLPAVVPVEWLNTTCTLYRRKALPDPLFLPVFTGYSLLEDVTLSLTVGKSWQLANARTARIYHDSQPGDHKRSATVLAEMELVNRHYVMTQVLGRRTLTDYGRLALLQLFQLAAALSSASGRRTLPGQVYGKMKGLYHILFSHSYSPNRVTQKETAHGLP